MDALSGITHRRKISRPRKWSLIDNPDIMKFKYDLRMIFPDSVDGSLPSEEERKEYESCMWDAVNEAEDRLVEERCDR